MNCAEQNNFNTPSLSLQSLENFSGMTTLIAQHLESFMRQIHDTEFPNSVEATEQLLIEQSAEYNRLKVRRFWHCHTLISIYFHRNFFHCAGGNFISWSARRRAFGGDSEEN